MSWARALQSGRWAAHQKFALPVVYRRRQIRALVERIEVQEAAWNRYFDSEKIDPLRVQYEELLENRASVLRSVLTFLELPDAASLTLPEPDLERQSDGLNQIWIERYRQEA